MSENALQAHSNEASAALHIDESQTRRVVFGALVGTALEWYDYFLFATASALVFNVQYFASKDPAVATLSSFATFAVGFLARPLGGAIFGWLGDKRGRKTVLMITIVGIGLVTGLIGFLPNYASIGIAAPIMLVVLRLLQGFCVGGEWSGAMTIAIENAPLEKRSWYASIPQIGSPIGTLLSSGGFFAVGAALSNEAFASWGWRTLFWAAIPLLLVSLWIRNRLEESPVFRELEAEEASRERAPLVEVFTKHFPQFLVGLLAALLGIAGFFLVTTFVVNYGVQKLKLSKNLMLAGNLVAATAEIGILLLAGKIGMRAGASKVALIGALLSAVIAFPCFLLITTRVPALVILGMTLAVLVLSIPYAAMGSILTGLFPARSRFTGVAMSSNGAAIVGGFVPMIAAGVTAWAGGHWWPAAVLLTVISLLTALGAFLAPRLSVDLGSSFRH
ncbi:MFS transporter [Mariniluteicoccus flavus]